MTFSDEVDRLFRQLVHVPWSSARPGATRTRDTELDLKVPCPEGELGDIVVTVREHELTIRARCRAGTPGSEERYVERSVRLPGAAEVRVIELRAEEHDLHVRVSLRAPGRGQ